MQSKVKGVPSFWCWSAQKGLYTACLGMLNQRRLAIVFDLDQTLVSCYNEQTFKTLTKKIESSLENPELADDTQLALRNQLAVMSPRINYFSRNTKRNVLSLSVMRLCGAKMKRACCINLAGCDKLLFGP
jgi:hypothetical protein